MAPLQMIAAILGREWRLFYESYIKNTLIPKVFESKKFWKKKKFFFHLKFKAEHKICDKSFKNIEYTICQYLIWIWFYFQVSKIMVFLCLYFFGFFDFWFPVE